LGDQYSVERILVFRWKLLNLDDVFAGDRQLAVTIVQQRPPNYTRIYPEILPSEAAF